MQHTQHSLAQFHWSQNSCLSSPPEMDKSTMLAERLETPCSPPTASANTAGPANHRRFPENGTDQTSIDKKLLFLATCGYLWGILQKHPSLPSKVPTSQHHCAGSKPAQGANASDTSGGKPNGMANTKKKVRSDEALIYSDMPTCSDIPLPSFAQFWCKVSPKDKQPGGFPTRSNALSTRAPKL